MIGTDQWEKGSNEVATSDPILSVVAYPLHTNNLDPTASAQNGLGPISPLSRLLATAEADNRAQCASGLPERDNQARVVSGRE